MNRATRVLAFYRAALTQQDETGTISNPYPCHHLSERIAQSRRLNRDQVISDRAIFFERVRAVVDSLPTAKRDLLLSDPPKDSMAARAFYKRRQRVLTTFEALLTQEGILTEGEV